MEITAKQVIERVRQQSGQNWRDSRTDIFTAGDPNAVVTGIATSFTPSIGVLKRAAAGGKNLVITQQPAYYGASDDYLKDDPAWQYKKSFIETHGLVIWRYEDNWNARGVDGQRQGLAKALGWDQYHVPVPGTPPYTGNDKYFKLPSGTLRQNMLEIEDKLTIRGIRVIGDPNTMIHVAALSHGMFQLSELQEFLRHPEVDLIVLAEAIEWESCEYFRDLLTWKGKNKAMILLGREASEDPGYGEVAAWLATFIPEVPVEWIAAHEPFWIP